MKKAIIAIVVFSVVIGTGIALFLMGTTTKTSVTNSPVAVGVLPNSLKEDEGALVHVEIGGRELLMLTSILPMVRPSSPARVTTLATGRAYTTTPATMGGFYGGIISNPTALLQNRYLVFPGEDASKNIELRVFDIVEKNVTESSVPLEVTAPDRGTSAESVVSYLSTMTTDQKNQIVYLLLRKDVQIGPGNIGTPTKSSTAEVWAFHRPTNTLEKKYAFAAEPSPQGSIDSYMLPTTVAFFQGALFLYWPDRLDRILVATGQRAVVMRTTLTSPEYLPTIFVSPSGERGIAFQRQGDAMTVFAINLDEGRFEKKASLPYALDARFWSRDERAVLFGNDGSGEVTRLDTTTWGGALQTLPQEHGAFPEAWLSDDEMLLRTQRDPSVPNEEQPANEFNELMPFYIWNTTSGNLTPMQNHRSPALLGTLD